MRFLESAQAQTAGYSRAVCCVQKANRALCERTLIMPYKERWRHAEIFVGIESRQHNDQVNADTRREHVARYERK
eukprot:9480780-Pyramimonas_sp.AAC.1